MPVPFLEGVAQPTRPFRVIELITLLVIAALIVAIALPRCGNSAAKKPAPPRNQPPPASATPAP